MDEMNENEVMAKYHELTEQLRDALARMEYSDRVFVIREEIPQFGNIFRHLQRLCIVSGNKHGDSAARARVNANNAIDFNFLFHLSFRISKQ